MVERLYRVVSNTIIERIVDGTYPPGAMLPSEMDLAAELGVSQGTVRKALIDLEQKGIIDRRQGRGTFVALRTPESSLFHFFRLRDPNGNQIVPELAQENVRRRAATDQERDALFGAPAEVYEINRVRSRRGVPLCYENCVVSTALFPGLQDRSPLPNTLYVLFQQAYSVIIISAEENLQAGLLGKVAAKALEADPGTPAITARRKTYDLLNRVVELRTTNYLTQENSYAVLLK